MLKRLMHAARAAVVHGIEPLVFIPIFLVMYGHGLAGQTPVLTIAFMLFGAVQEQPGVQRWLGGGDPSGNAAVRMFLLHATVAGVIYTLGWGPLLTVPYAMSTVLHMRWSGKASLWRQSIAFTAALTTAGQAAIALHWIPSYLPQGQAQAAGVFGAATTMMLIRIIGGASEKREEAETQVRRREERFRALVQDSTDVVALAEISGRLLYLSPAVQAVMGVAPEAMQGSDFGRWIEPDDLPIASRLFADVLGDPARQHHDELRVRHADGGYRWVEATVRNLTDNPAVGGIVANFRDITERKAIQERLAYDASHDALTGLANRATLLRELETAFADTRDAGRALAVVFVDLDGFKQVNDRFGHEAGDTLIVAVAAMLKRAVQDADPVGRLGGDEFGIVLGDIEEPADVTAVAERILTEMAEPVGVAGHEIHARASIGLAISSPACASANDLLHHADVAMYHAKRRGKHTYHLFTEGASDPMAAAGATGRW